MQLQLTADEVTILQDVLAAALGELREQIYKAEVAEYKETLKRRESLVQGLLARMRATAV